MTTAYRTGREGKPRIIRKVLKIAKDGRVKIARDRKTLISMERIKARTAKPCSYWKCKELAGAGIIDAGEEFARLTSPLHTQRMGVRTVPVPKDYHFECVPPEARPLVRFFFPKT